MSPTPAFYTAVDVYRVVQWVGLFEMRRTRAIDSSDNDLSISITYGPATEQHFFNNVRFAHWYKAHALITLVQYEKTVKRAVYIATMRTRHTATAW